MKKKTVKSLSMELKHAEKVNKELREKLLKRGEAEAARNMELNNELSNLRMEKALNFQPGDMSLRYAKRESSISADASRLAADNERLSKTVVELRGLIKDQEEVKPDYEIPVFDPKKRFRAACAFIAGGHCMSIQGAIDSADELLRKLKGGD